MKATDILRAQHAEIRALLKSAVNDGADRGVTVDRLAARLRLHTRLEERQVYPAIRESEPSRKTGDLVVDAYEEHAVADLVLMRLLASDPRSEQARSRARVLQDIVERHLEEEEHVLFKQAERLGDERLEEIGARIHAEIEEVEELDALFGLAARAARRTEQWAGSWLDRSIGLPRRALSVLAPTRLLGLGTPPSQRWVTAIARTVPKWMVDGVYQRVVGNGGVGDGTTSPREPRGGRRHSAER